MYDLFSALAPATNQHDYCREEREPSTRPTRTENLIKTTGLQWNIKYHEHDISQEELNYLRSAVEIGNVSTIVKAIRNSEGLYNAVKKTFLQDIARSSVELCSTKNPSILRSHRSCHKLLDEVDLMNEVLTEIKQR